jgi:hypothetical protein
VEKNANENFFGTFLAEMELCKIDSFLICPAAQRSLAGEIWTTEGDPTSQLSTPLDGGGDTDDSRFRSFAESGTDVKIFKTIFDKKLAFFCSDYC